MATELKAVTASESKKRKRKPWERSQGWTSVSVGDGLLVGSSEGGFCGLEEFTPSEPIIIDGGTEDVSQANADIPPRETGNAKTKRGKEGKAQPNLAAVEELHEKLAAAEAEIKRLRQLVKQKSGKRQKVDSQAQAADPGQAIDSPTLEEAKEKPLSHKERKRLQRAAYKLAKRDLLKKEKAAQRQARKKDEKQKQQQDKASRAPLPSAVNHGETETTVPAALDMSAWKVFDLDLQIEEALRQLGFTMPTPIQQECLAPAIRDRRDVIGAAQTGSGKTLAFGLPIIQALLAERRRVESQKDMAEGKDQDAAETEDSPRRLRALILAPTRELAIQVSEHLQAVGKPCGVWVTPIVGGIAVEKQERYLRGKPEVVVATPGRLWELMRDGAEHLTDMSDLSFLVLDEADRMVQQGHYEELTSILDFVPQSRGANKTGSRQEEPAEDTAEEASKEAVTEKRRKLQTFVFSATLTLPEKLRKRLRKGGGGSSGSVTLENLMEKISFGHKPKIADLTSKRRLADKVTEAYLECTEDNREERLYYLLTQHPGRTLVFANAISMVRRLAAVLKLLQLPVTAMHSSMQQRQRLKALERFRKSDSAILVATDVAARGLDIPEVACVVHYQLPAAADVYVHRCGRTARASAEGLSVALVTPKESARFAALEKAMSQDTLPLFPLDYNLLPGARKRVQLASKLDDLLRSSSKKSAEKTWEQQMAEAAGIILSDDEEDEEPSVAGQEDQRATAKALQQELAALLHEPLQPKYSQRFFAGQPSAALAAQAADASSQPKDTINSQAVSQAVTHATQLAKARASGSAAVAAKLKKQGRKKGARTAPEVHRRKAVADALKSQVGSQKKRGRSGELKLGKSRFVVIPGAMAREVRGPKALDALRSKLTSSQGLA